MYTCAVMFISMLFCFIYFHLVLRSRCAILSRVSGHFSLHFSVCYCVFRARTFGPRVCDAPTCTTTTSTRCVAIQEVGASDNIGINVLRGSSNNVDDVDATLGSFLPQVGTPPPRTHTHTALRVAGCCGLAVRFGSLPRMRTYISIVC